MVLPMVMVMPLEEITMLVSLKRVFLMVREFTIGRPAKFIREIGAKACGMEPVNIHLLTTEKTQHFQAGGKRTNLWDQIIMKQLIR